MKIVDNDNILKFTGLRKTFNEYGCKCRDRTFTVDFKTRIVVCNKCKNIVDPMDALMELAEHQSRYQEEYREFIEWRGKNRHLKAIKRIEELSSYGKNTPVCPICKNPFEFF